VADRSNDVSNSGFQFVFIFRDVDLALR